MFCCRNCFCSCTTVVGALGESLVVFEVLLIVPGNLLVVLLVAVALGKFVGLRFMFC